LEKAAKIEKWPRPASAVAYISKGFSDWQQSAKVGKCPQKRPTKKAGKKGRQQLLKGCQ
jgi:hypothetical protein